MAQIGCDRLALSHNNAQQVNSQATRSVRLSLMPEANMVSEPLFTTAHDGMLKALNKSGDTAACAASLFVFGYGCLAAWSFATT